MGKFSYAIVKRLFPRRNKGKYTVGTDIMNAYNVFLLLVGFLFLFELVTVEQNVFSGNLSLANGTFSPITKEFLLSTFIIIPAWIGYLLVSFGYFKENPYVKAVPLRAIFRVRRWWYGIFASFFLFLLVGSLTYSDLVPSRYLLGFNFLSFAILLVFLNLLALSIYRFGVYFFSPGFVNRIRKLFHGLLSSSIVGGESLKILASYNEHTELSNPSYSFLLVQIHSALSDLMRFEFPRMRISGVDDVVVNILLTMRIGSPEEKARVAEFFDKLGGMFPSLTGRKRTTEINDLLEELSSTSEQLDNAEKFRTSFDVVGYWNVRVWELYKRYERLINLASTIVIILLTAYLAKLI